MTKLRHVGIVVSDIEKSLELYRDYFNFSVVWDQLESGKFIDEILGQERISVRTVKMTGPDGGMIELLHYVSHDPKKVDNDLIQFGCSHFSLTVKDVEKASFDLRGLGLKFISLPKLSENGKAKVCFCRDFDGTFIELVQEVF